MPPMATSSSKRKWSDVFEDGDQFDKQSLMDLCASKLRYVNPAQPPRRRTEVPLLRNVLIVNTMKHLTSDFRFEKPMDYSTEDLSVDPGHFEGLPPLSELLTDIMLDPQPMDQQQWALPGTAYSSLTPLEPTIPSYLDTSGSGIEAMDEGKTVHDLLPCTSVIGMNHQQHVSWDTHDNLCQDSSLQSWTTQTSSEHSTHSWVPSGNSNNVLDCFLSSASVGRYSSNTSQSAGSESAFQSSSGPLPSFTSLFETPQSSFTELLQSQPDSITSQASYFSSNASSLHIQGASADEFVGNVNLSEAELELLAMTFSSKLSPNMSFEELVHALPPTSFLQSSQPSQTFFVPSSLQSNTSSPEPSATVNNQCASYCRKDQAQPSVDDSGMVRVLVNL